MEDQDTRTEHKVIIINHFYHFVVFNKDNKADSN